MSDLSAEKVVAELRKRATAFGKLHGNYLHYGAVDHLIDTEAAALIEQQAAELAAKDEQLGNLDRCCEQMQADAISWVDRIHAAEARVTALEAEKATVRDPISVHRNMLAGTIAKPSIVNIAHLYPEVQQMRQALIATLKHFRRPTSAEHETRDKVMTALEPFGDLPLEPMALSRLSTEVKNDER